MIWDGPENLRQQAAEAVHGLADAQQRMAVVDEALTWLGTPYHHLGRVKGAGTDCGQFLAGVYDAAGVIPNPEVPDDYPHDWHLHRGEERYLQAVLKYAKAVEHPAPGDVAVFRYGRCISHGGIILLWPVMIHSYLRIGVTLDDVEQTVEFRTRLKGFFSPWRKA